MPSHATIKWPAPHAAKTSLSALVLVLIGVLAGACDSSATHAGALVASTAPRPCVVGSAGCGPLPTVPRHGIRTYRFGRVAAPNGLLRPGAYDSIWKNNALHLGFSVGRGWSWNGQTLSKGNAAVSFYLAPVLVYADPCHWDQPQHPAVKPALASGDVILNELAAQPMRYATHPTSAYDDQGTSYRGVIRLTVPSNLDVSRCDHGQYRTWGSGANTLLARGAGQRDLIWARYPGLGFGDTMLLIDASTFPDTPARLVHQVDNVLGSVSACRSCG